MPDELEVTKTTEEEKVTWENPPPEEPPKQIDEPPDPSALQAEIERLRKVREEEEKKAREAKEKADYWRKQKAEARGEYFRREPEKPPEKAEPFGDKPPTRDEFEDYDQYVDALTDWKVKKAKAEWERDVERKKSDFIKQEKISAMNAKIQAGYQKYPDFEDVAMDPGVPITPVVIDILAESEIPEDVAYYLGKNRGEAIKIARMTPIQAAREIARIEMEIKAMQKENPPKKTVTNAPPPIKPLGATHTISKDLDKMSQKEYEEEMAKRTGYRY